MKNIEMWAGWLVVLGGLNWGLIGLFNFDLVAELFGPMSSLTRLVYVLVGAAAVYMAYYMMPNKKK